MRHVFAAGFVVVVFVVIAAHATAAAPPLSARSPDGKKVAEVRARASGGDGLWIDGRQVWPPAAESKRRATITARPTWARAGNAVAWLQRETGGATTLVVSLVGGDAGGQALEWTVPPAALPARSIMWMGASRLAVGPREMEPRLVASWNEPTAAASR
jgi:hypothetical protein